MKDYIYKNKLLFILLAAMFTIIGLIFFVKLPFIGYKQNIIDIKEENGVYDLRDIKSLDDKVARLAPGTHYYINEYLMPDTLDIVRRDSGNDLYENRADYLTQHFIILMPDNSDAYTLTCKLSGRHAMRVFVNGRIAGETGRLGTDKNDTVVWENNITFHGSPIEGKIDVLIHSAQFYHVKRGASLGELYIGKDSAATDPFFHDRLKGIGLMGAFLTAAVLLMGIYLLLSPTKATLYFAIACIVMALRECLQSQAWIYFPIPGDLSFMLEYLSVVLLTIFLTLYLTQYSEGKLLRVIKYIAIIGSCLYGIFVLLGDSILYTSILKYYQALLVICIIPGISVLLWNMRDPIIEKSTAMYGIAVFYMAALYDIFMYSNIFSMKSNEPISEIAMLIFAFAQTMSLFQMNNRVLGEAKEMEKKLELENVALESLNRLKTEFLGNVSHELKTPLTVMSGYAQTTKELAAGSDAPEAHEVSRRMTLISAEAERLSLMVGQILDVTRMEEGRMVMEPARCHIDEIIHLAVETHYPILNKNHNRLDIRIENGLPAIHADPSRVSQVIVNLISNAVRFTSEGTITISAKKENDHILIIVSDTGTGIAAERLPHIFERYAKKEKPQGGTDTGTGLGLYICKYIVEQQEGRIWIESEEGYGTSVFFTMPLYEA